MSFLSTSLDHLMKERDWTQTELAQRTGIAQSNISRYLNGVAPDSEMLDKLCAPFGAEAAALVVAWTQDLTPPKLRHLANVEPAAGRAIARKDSTGELLARLSPRVRKLALEIALASEDDPAVFTAFESTMALIARRTGDGAR